MKLEKKIVLLGGLCITRGRKSIWLVRIFALIHPEGDWPRSTSYDRFIASEISGWKTTRSTRRKSASQSLQSDTITDKRLRRVKIVVLEAWKECSKTFLHLGIYHIVFNIMIIKPCIYQHYALKTNTYLDQNARGGPYHLCHAALLSVTNKQTSISQRDICKAKNSAHFKTLSHRLPRRGKCVRR